MSQLSVLPFAAASALGFYLLMVAFCFPKVRRLFDSYCHDGGRNTLKGFDFLRGLAAAAVALGHAFQFCQPVFEKSLRYLPGIVYSSKAVGIFAVLSGFLIYRSVMSVKNSEDLNRFFVKRFFRIYPVYLASVLVCVLFSQYVSLIPQDGWPFFLRDLFMVRIAVFPHPFTNGANPVFWSLYVEVLFYWLLPMVLLAINKRHVVVVSTTIFAFLILLDNGDCSFGLWKFFLCGILASELSPHLKKASLPAFLLGVALCLYDFSGPSCDWVAALHIGSAHPHLDTFGLAIGGGLMVAALPNLKNVGNFFDLFALRHLGTISYSVYLTHMLFYLACFPSLGCLRMVQIPCPEAIALGKLPALILPLMVLPAVLFWSFVMFTFVERPGILLGRFLLKRKPKLQVGIKTTSVPERKETTEVREPVGV